MADEEAVEGEEAQPAATEFVPEQSAKPKSNVYSVLLILTFCAFFAGCWIAGNEAFNHYDVTFFGIFGKQPTRAAETGGGGATPTSTEAPKDGAPAPAPMPKDSEKK